MTLGPPLTTAKPCPHPTNPLFVQLPTKVCNDPRTPTDHSQATPHPTDPLFVQLPNKVLNDPQTSADHTQATPHSMDPLFVQLPTKVCNDPRTPLTTPKAQPIKQIHYLSDYLLPWANVLLTTAKPFPHPTDTIFV